MARLSSHRLQDQSVKPLADYFWIAGLDGQDLLNAYRITRYPGQGHGKDQFDAPLRRGVGATIQEDAPKGSNITTNGDSSPTTTTKHSRNDSYRRLSKLSDEARFSIQSLDQLTNMSSARSSTTIRPNPSPGNFNSKRASILSHAQPELEEPNLLSDADFEKALSKFNMDRDSFFLDLNFKSGAANGSSQHVQTQPRAPRIVPDDLDNVGGISTRTNGTVKRHMTFKDMNSTKRQPSMTNKRMSIRTSRRMSSYNSVMPDPEPLEISQNEHPLKQTFAPVLLDRYPRPTTIDQLPLHEQFPDYVPMFAFPNDINVISSDTRPRSTWHEFTMTALDNSRISAVCLTTWVPMNRQTADELEKRCEEWRQANMTDAEREMAGSLAGRLALERAKLSRLLAMLPTAAPDSRDREELEEEIGVVEEKIALMADMLRPLRHGAASKIDGLTDGDTGFWIPRAYGILGKEQCLVGVWKEWLKAVTVPMMDGAILRVPASSPRVGMWQPLERYVHNICSEALSPLSSKTQSEIAVRELRLYAKQEATNELPGSRTTDIYPLFRALTIPNIIVLMEYLLAESRIVLVSTHASMLKLASKALLNLLWPLEWAGVYIPVLPSRLMGVLDAPCPYICGVVRGSGNLHLPEDDDFVMVDLDRNELRAIEHPPSLPKQQRKKLMSLLYLAAPHHASCGVPVGPPAYAIETFPNDTFSSEHPNLFTASTPSTNLAKLMGMSSTQFGSAAVPNGMRQYPIFNAFLQASRMSTKSLDRRTSVSTSGKTSQPDSDTFSPMTATFGTAPGTPQSRNDSSFALHTSLREKRSGHFDSWSRRGESISILRRKASLPFVRHAANPSNASTAPSSYGGSTYANSSYAQSTLAASTIMPGMTFQPALNTETTSWIEGHRFEWRPNDGSLTCSVCDEKTDDGHYRCSGCSVIAHGRCATGVCIVCSAAFLPDQVRAAFARVFTSLFYSYRKFMRPADAIQKRSGIVYKLNVEAWSRSLNPEHGAYIQLLHQTQAFNEFISERESRNSSSADSVALFDALVAAKKGRSGRMRSGLAMSISSRNPFAQRSPSGGGAGMINSDYLSDTANHTWRLVSVLCSSEKPDLGPAANRRDYHSIVTRSPAKLDDDLFAREKMAKKRAPTMSEDTSNLRQKMNGLNMNAP